MRPIDLKLRCFAQTEPDGSWLAVCVDLNLVAQAGSFEAARYKLHHIIDDYLTEALTSDKAYLDDLVPRKAPLLFFIKYYFLYLKSRLVKLSNLNHSRLFTEHLPLIPSANTHGR